jgi:CHASE1-domain containing sensor protein
MSSDRAVTTEPPGSSEEARGCPPPASEVTLRTRSLAARGLPVAITLIGVAVSLAVFALTALRGRAARRIEFDRQAASVARAAQASFDVPLEVLRSIPALFGASEMVTRAEFRSFVQPSLSRYPWIYALEWIPRVPGSERNAFEAAARNDGLTGYHFKQDAPKGPPVVADERAEYFPLYYMEPANNVALGIEETALPVRQAALERARDSNATVITEQLRLVQDVRTIVSVIAFHPVYRHGARLSSIEARRESLVGYAAAVFRVEPVVKAALRKVDFEALDAVLVDVEARPPAVLFESRPGGARALGQNGQAVWEHVATLGGRRWAFRVGDRAGVVRAPLSDWLTLVIGLLISALAAALARAYQATRRLRRQVDASRHLGQYTLVEKLGEGGMGTVYRAHHALLRRPTAIKLLHPLRRNATALARFESEVQLTSSLTHPNTVVVYDYGHTPEGLFYYAMEYIDGITLQELVDIDGGQAPERVVSILMHICAALAEAHAIGLVHRDIKPANIMLCRRGGIWDFVKVLDFGLAKDLTASGTANLSQSTELLGTPLYLAPEAVLGRPIDARVDIYALGAVAYFVLTGSTVFDGGTALEVYVKTVSQPPEPVAQRLGREPCRALEALIMQCLAKDPSERPASADVLARALRDTGVRPWSADEADRWWREHGQRVTDRVHAVRRGRQRQPSGVTIEMDPRRSVEYAETRLADRG